MNYVEKFKSKKQKWLEIALIFAVLILIVGGLIFHGLNQPVDNTQNINGTQTATAEEENKYWYVKYIIGIIILYYLFKSRKPLLPMKTDDEIINFVADEIYNTKGEYLNTQLNNVKVEKGAPNETYVEFTKEHMTYLYFEGVGIIERYMGETIRMVKETKQQDSIQIKLADIGIANKKHMEKLEAYGLTEEVQ